MIHFSSCPLDVYSTAVFLWLWATSQSRGHHSLFRPVCQPDTVQPEAALQWTYAGLHHECSRDGPQDTRVSLPTTGAGTEYKYHFLSLSHRVYIVNFFKIRLAILPSKNVMKWAYLLLCRSTCSWTLRTAQRMRSVPFLMKSATLCWFFIMLCLHTAVSLHSEYQVYWSKHFELTLRMAALNKSYGILIKHFTLRCSYWRRGTRGRSG